MAELPNKETLTVEFKSDRKRLPDDDLVTTAVAMANTEGGVIYLGMEDDGTSAAEARWQPRKRAHTPARYSGKVEPDGSCGLPDGGRGV
jgi:ATP-dependent DNA helicase RecG